MRARMSPTIAAAADAWRSHGGAAAAAAASPPSASAASSSSVCRPSAAVISSLCLDLQLAGVLLDSSERDREALLAAANWDVTRAIEAYFAAEASIADEDDEDEDDEEEGGRNNTVDMRKDVGGAGASERADASAAAAAAAPAPAAAAAAPPAIPARLEIEVHSDSDLTRTYDYSSSRPFAKLFRHFAGESKRRLEFFYRGAPVSDTDTPASLGMTSRKERMEACAPVGIKRSFTLPGTQTQAAAAAADALAASRAESAQRAALPLASPPAPPLKRSKTASGAAASSMSSSAAASSADASVPAASAFVSTWSELPLGVVDFGVLQSCQPLDEQGVRIPERPAHMAALASFVREMERNRWSAAKQHDGEVEADGADREAHNERLVQLLRSLVRASSMFKGTLHTMRLSLSLLPGAHDSFVPDGNFLLPLLHPAFADIVARELPPRPTPSHVRHAAPLMDLSVRTTFRRGGAAAYPRMEVLDEEVEEEKKEGAVMGNSATAGDSAASAAAAAAMTPDSQLLANMGATAPAAPLSDLESLRVQWGLPPVDVADDFSLCPQTASLLHLSDEELSRRCGLNLTLRDYQCQTVLWALKQECSGPMAAAYWCEVEIDKQRVWYSPFMQALRFMPLPPTTGGMVCDEMGLGKTVDMLALIHLHPASAADLAIAAPTPASSSSASSARLALSPSKCTLILASTSLVGQWFSEISSRSLSGRELKVLCWYGATRTQDLSRLLDYDVVISTFGIVKTEAKRAEASPMFRCRWHRIIVDESHSIKSRTARQSQHILSLHSPRRWLLSGTPVSSVIDDLLHQFDFFGIPLLSHTRVLAMLRHHIFAKGGDEARDSSPREACALLLRLLTHHVMRHKKVQPFDGRTELVSLPPRTLDTIRVQFRPEERVAYDRMIEFARSRLTELAAKRSLAAQHVQVVSLLSPLRQACSSGKHDLNELLEKLRAIAAAEQAKADAAAAAVQSEFEQEYAFNDGSECAICISEMEEPMMPPCRHAFCAACILGFLGAAAKAEKECPLCRVPFNRKQLRQPPKRPVPSAASSVTGGSSTSTSSTSAACDVPLPASIVFTSKVDALLTQLTLLRQTQPNTKALVFSQFTQTINTLAERLRDAGIGAVALTGNMTVMQRKEALQHFVHDPSCTVFLLSLKSSGAGLSLTCAHEVYMMEPALNPALTQQAISRVHRLGQTRPVRIHHLVMQNSVEERILQATQAAIEAKLDDDAIHRAARATKDSAMRGIDLAALFN